uniref:Uncharacterized protein n=1 Tax=Anguilla anguilla TaxID=7936 RepID=A0A0E9PDN4_ANGAN
MESVSGEGRSPYHCTLTLWPSHQTVTCPSVISLSVHYLGCHT